MLLRSKGIKGSSFWVDENEDREKVTKKLPKIQSESDRGGKFRFIIGLLSDRGLTLRCLFGERYRRRIGEPYAGNLHVRF